MNRWNKQGRCANCQHLYRKGWAKTNSSRLNEIARNRYAQNPEKQKQATKKWTQANPGKAAAAIAKYLTKKASATGSYTGAEWVELCARYGNRCLCCGRDDVPLTADHVIPVTKGGTNDIGNMQPLCTSCNSRKHNRTADYRPDSGNYERWTQKKLF